MNTRPQAPAPDDGLSPGVVTSASALTATTGRLDADHQGRDRLWSIDDIAFYLGVCRRKVEQLRSSGKLPKADLYVGKLPRWRGATIRDWSGEKAPGRAVGR
jgi:hypothetical protein